MITDKLVREPGADPGAGPGGLQAPVEIRLALEVPLSGLFLFKMN